MEIQTKLNWGKFELLFGTWASKLKPFFDYGGFDPIYKKLKEESAIGKTICPHSENVFRAFKECSFNDLNLVILGLSPYHTLKNGEPVADGLCLSCSITNYLQPSLYQWYSAIEQELYNGICLPCIRNPDLKFLANQNVLMLNAALTTEKGLPGSHVELWVSFMKYLFTEVLNGTNVPIIYLGVEAERTSIYSTSSWQFKLSHPASASYKNNTWDSKETFTKVNEVLKNSNNTEIKWLDDLPF